MPAYRADILTQMLSTVSFHRDDPAADHQQPRGRSREAVREHAARVDMPADEILEVADTVVIRPDPEPLEAGAEAG